MKTHKILLLLDIRYSIVMLVLTKVKTYNITLPLEEELRKQKAEERPNNAKENLFIRIIPQIRHNLLLENNPVSFEFFQNGQIYFFSNGELHTGSFYLSVQD